VDDDDDTCNVLNEFLTQKHFLIDIAHDASQAVNQIEKARPDLILLDIQLPDMDGLTLMKMLKEHRINIILLSANTEVDTRVYGLELGAQDYVTKPFHLRELLARIKTILERSQAPHDSYRLAAKIGNWMIDRQKRTLSYRNNSIKLTTHEYKLLHYLAVMANQEVSRNEISQELYNMDWTPSARRIDTLIYQLRQKFKSHPEKIVIESLHNKGYMLIADVTWQRRS